MKNRAFVPIALVSAGLVLLSGFLIAPGAAFAGPPVGTTGLEGEVYLVQVGTASELLPHAEAEDDRLILALEILRPGEKPEWIEIPQSEGVRADASPFALFEEASDTLFVVWQTRIGSHPVIKLTSFQDGVWGEVTPVSNDVWSFKGSPQLAMTRDTFKVEHDGDVQTVERTFLHVVWWEDTIEGLQIVYRPLIIERGRLEGMGELYVLNDLVELPATDSGDRGPKSPPNRSLLESPVLQPGRDSSSVVTAFADASSGRLAVAEIRLLPRGLGHWAAEIQELIANYEPEESAGEGGIDLRALADVVRSSILITGQRHRLNPRAVRDIAQTVHSGLLDGSLAAPSSSAPVTGAADGQIPRNELKPLADVVRSSILITGARIAGETLDRYEQIAAPSVLEMGAADADTGEVDAPHLVRSQLLSSIEAPELPATAHPHLFVSPDGSELIVAWAEEEALAYRKSMAGAWSEVRRMGLSEELTLDEALQILDRSVRPHR